MMKNLFLTALFAGLLFSANVSMANSQMTQQSTTAQTVETKQDQTKEMPSEPKPNTEVIDEMVHSKLQTQMMLLASAKPKVENCWAWDACIESPASNDHGYDSYAFN